MKTGVYFCKCGTNISEKIDPAAVKDLIADASPELHFKAIDFICSEEGKEVLEKDLKENRIDRVVIAACSPRDHEHTFMKVLSQAGINPYLMQMVNVREQIAWVTNDKAEAVAKASRYIKTAIKRVSLHAPIEKKEIDICPDALVIGAGPAGLKAALSIAGAGRKVVIVEKTPVIGGMPVRFEEIAPGMECGPCMLEPLLGDLLHGEYSENIELLTISEVIEVKGSYGNFIVKIRKSPRHVDINACIGCQACLDLCPVSAGNDFNCGFDQRKAISFPFTSALPNAPFIDDSICLRKKGEDCHLCRDACPVAEAIVYDDTETVLERNVGAIVVATGAGMYDCRNLPNLGYGTFPEVLTALDFERTMASNGPSGGEIKTSRGELPSSFAIIHCVGSLDKDHKEYCSGICCQYALKFNHMIRKKFPDAKIYHFYKELSVPGKDDFSLLNHARESAETVFIRYANLKDLHIKEDATKRIIKLTGPAVKLNIIHADMVILCPAVVPSEGSLRVSAVIEANCDKTGFFEALHDRMDSSQSRVKGIYFAGSCQSPMDIQKATNQGMAAAGYILSGLVAGRKLEINAITAVIDPDRCSGCKVCISVCPYKAISYDDQKETAMISDVLCQGCGTCVAACPSGCIEGNHFTNAEIFAEIEGLLE